MTEADTYENSNGNGNDNENGCCCGVGGDTNDLVGGQFEDKGQTPLTRGWQTMTKWTRSPAVAAIHSADYWLGLQSVVLSDR